MSEKTTNNPDDFDALAESQKRAAPGRQIYEDFMERNAEENLSPEQHTEAYQQMADYLQSRPYKDRNGKLHDPVTGKYITDEDAGLFYTPSQVETSSESPYKSMSLAALVALSADSEIHGDRTMMDDVDDEIQERIIAMDLKDELIDRDGSERINPENGLKVTERDMVLEHVMKLREQYLKKMKEDSQEDSEHSETEKSLDDEINDAAKRVVGEGEELAEPEENTGEGSEAEPENGNTWAPPDPNERVDGPTPTPESTEETNPEDVENKGERMEVDPTLQEALEYSRSRYASLSATRRNETLTRSKEQLAKAKEEYETALRLCGERALEILNESGLSAEEIKQLTVASLIAEQSKLHHQIASERIAISDNKRLSKFYQWFGRQKGFSGKVKKVLAVGTLTAPLGVVAGIAGLTLLGPVAGAAVGAALARGIAKGLASSKVSKEAGARSHAQDQQVQDVMAGVLALNEYLSKNNGELPSAEVITRLAEERTKEQVSSNRKRTAKVATIGALVGGVSALAVSWVHDLMNGKGPSGSTIVESSNTTPSGASTVVEIPSDTSAVVDALTPQAPPTFLDPGSLPQVTARYPWGWGEKLFGAARSTEMMQTLSERAARAGHIVEWHNSGAPNGSWVEIDGLSDTESVVNIMKQYIKPGELKP